MVSKTPISFSNVIGVSISSYAFNWKWESISSWTLYCCPICPWSGLPGSTISKFSNLTFSLYDIFCSKSILSFGSVSTVNMFVVESQETTLPLWVVKASSIVNIPLISPKISLVLADPNGAVGYLNPLSVISTSNIWPISLVKATSSAELPDALVIVRVGNLE